MDNNQLWDAFAEHIRSDLAAGGPDPHMRCVGEMIKDVPLDEKIWRIGCYVAVYNVPTAEFIWREWPWKRFHEHSEEFPGWIKENWSKLQFRRERRAVRTPVKLAKYFMSYREWVYSYGRVMDVLPPDPKRAFLPVWATVDSVVYGAGRYAIRKLLQCYERYCDAPITLPDILPKGGWSPRVTLTDLWPNLNLDAYDNSPHMIEFTNLVVQKSLARLAENYDLDLDLFRFEVFCCDFKQSYKGGKQYPGRSNDSELMYHDKIRKHVDLGEAMWAARQKLMPAVCRGEVSGWRTTRDELGTVLTSHGYVWSDIRYDYLATEDLSQPVRREGDTDQTVRDLAQRTISAW
jgi:hypothetical protein